VLTTSRQDGTALTTPVWFRWTGGNEAGERFAAARVSKPGVLVRLVPEHPRIWDLAGILPP
jgi:hypothetical protein